MGALATPRATHRATVWHVLLRDPSFVIGATMVTAIMGMAVLAPLLAPHDPIAQDFTNGLSDRGDPVGPSALYPLGTDLLGRDLLSRLIYGAVTSLVVGIGANALATVIGVLVGATAATCGNGSFGIGIGRGRSVRVPLPIESVLMRTTDIMLSLPVLLLAIALVAIVGPSLFIVLMVVALVLWGPTARIVYGRVLVARESDFVEAAVALGASGRRVFWRHILPHIVPVIVVYATLGITSAVLFEATLAYLGVGVPPPAASWGRMISEHVGYYATDPRLVLLPGLAIMFTILGFSLLGDAVRDALDPRTTHRVR